MKRTIMYLETALLGLTSVLAGNYPSGDMNGGMMNDGMRRGMYGGGHALVGLLFFIAACFIFSLIFWLTNRWVMGDKLKTDKNKKKR